MIKIFQSNRIDSMTPEDLDELSQDAQHSTRLPLLSKDEVIALAQRKDAGRNADGEYTPAGLAARNTLVEHNLQLVSRIARSWVGRGVAFADLKQEGAIGLMRAADLFDWTKGNEFSTYASQRIVSACQRAIENQAETIRIPVHTRSSGRCAPEVERAKRVVSGNQVMRGHGGSAAPRSIESSLFDIIPSDVDTATEALAPLEAAERRGIIGQLFAALTDRERQVVEMHLIGEMTMREAAKVLGISYQTVAHDVITARSKMMSVYLGGSGKLTLGQDQIVKLLRSIKQAEGVEVDY